jgi:hypothetical protein
MDAFRDAHREDLWPAIARFADLAFRAPEEAARFEGIPGIGLRELTGVGLAEAKEAIDRAERFIK